METESRNIDFFFFNKKKRFFFLLFFQFDPRCFICQISLMEVALIYERIECRSMIYIYRKPNIPLVKKKSAASPK